MHTVNSIFKRK